MGKPQSSIRQRTYKEKLLRIADDCITYPDVDADCILMELALHLKFGTFPVGYTVISDGMSDLYIFKTVCSLFLRFCARPIESRTKKKREKKKA